MIIANGTIERKNKVAMGIDPATGYPIVPKAVTWGEPIPCQYVAAKHDWLRQVGGEHYTEASYDIYIEEQPFDAEQVRLRDKYGNLVGDYSIIQVKPLQAVCELLIKV